MYLHVFSELCTLRRVDRIGHSNGRDFTKLIQLNNAPLESLSHSQVHVCITTVLRLGGL